MKNTRNEEQTQNNSNCYKKQRNFCVSFLQKRKSGTSATLMLRTHLIAKSSGKLLLIHEQLTKFEQYLIIEKDRFVCYENESAWFFYN